MSYCVNCGVELNPGAKSCPLCQTPVYNPANPPREGEPPFFSPNRVEVEPVSKIELALLLTVMLVSATVGCSVINIFLAPQVRWSLYVTGAAAMLWVWFVLPLVARRLPMWVLIPLDVAAVGLYAFLICMAREANWFWPLAFPLAVAGCVTAFTLGFLFRGHRRSFLSAMALDIFAFGVFALVTEFYGDWYFYEEWTLGWSLVVFLSCITLIVPLIIIRRVPALREEARRRFHL